MHTHTRLEVGCERHVLCVPGRFDGFLCFRHGITDQQGKKLEKDAYVDVTACPLVESNVLRLRLPLAVRALMTATPRLFIVKGEYDIPTELVSGWPSISTYAGSPPGFGMTMSQSEPVVTTGGWALFGRLIGYGCKLRPSRGVAARGRGIDVTIECLQY